MNTSTPTKYHVPVEQAANLVTTIRNLRELATHAEKFPEQRLDMRHYRFTEIHDEVIVHPRSMGGVASPIHPDGPLLCLLGIADAFGMGVEIPNYGWMEYWEQLFPYLEFLCDEYFNVRPFEALFGPELKSNLSIRVLNLHLAADMLERTGQLDYERLLS